MQGKSVKESQVRVRKQLLVSELFQNWLDGINKFAQRCSASRFSKLNFFCDQCKQSYPFDSVNPQEWWIDRLENLESREPHNRCLFDLCQQCRETNASKPNLHEDSDHETDTCERCCIDGVYGYGKWVEGGNLLYNCLYQKTLCLDCNEKLHYNK